MIKTLGVIDAVSHPRGQLVSSCSPERLVHRRVHGQNIVAWVASRVIQAQELDRVVVAADPAIVQELQRLTPSYATIYPSRASDVIQMLVELTARIPAHAIVRVGIDCPLVDPEMIDHLVATANLRGDCDYLGFRLNDGRPAMMSRIGVFGEWCRVSALITADRETVASADRCSLTHCFCHHAELFDVAMIPVPENDRVAKLRLAIDHTDDLDVVDEIIDALGPDQIDLHHVAELLEQHPSLRERLHETRPTKELAAH